MADPVRLAFLGVDHSHAPGKVRWARDLPDIELAGAYEPSAHVRAARARLPHCKGIRWIETIDGVLGDPSIVGVFIGGNERQNPSYARRALAAGKHVLMEKACGWTKAHADELIGTAERKGLLFQMGYNFRWYPHIKRILDMCDAGKFGSVHMVRCHMSGAHGPAPGAFPDGVPYFRGGIFYNLGSHALDMVMAVLGTPKRVQPFLRTDGHLGSGYVDNTLVVLEYDRAIAAIDLSHLETEQRRPRRLEVYGAAAQAIASPFAPAGDLAGAVEVHTGGVVAGVEGWTRYGADPFEQFRGDLEEFVACVRGAKRPRFSYAH
ncbi:MAG: Gfo/Idh/MocA family oxidoreductase, partial [Actinobacteria bacterium]|nr:Gfo/Idh/MocA family oxidoreductase [Actinomycetota bacterium]